MANVLQIWWKNKHKLTLISGRTKTIMENEHFLIGGAILGDDAIPPIVFFLGSPLGYKNWLPFQQYISKHRQQ